MTNFRPIDSFKNYFLDIKPYHTKILEIVEQYNIQEDLLLKFGENLFVNIDYKNDPVCKPVGYGIEWDDECGFDAVDCCDLFECLGGYGLIYDNSDLVAEYEILDLNVDNDSVIVSGNQTRDARFQINTIPATDIITVTGDITNQINDIKLLVIVPVKTVSILDNTAGTVVIEGNFTDVLIANKEFNVYSTEDSDGIYRVATSTYDPINNTTTVEILSPGILNETIENGFMEFRINSRNSGFYSIESYTFDGAVTSIFLDDNTQLPFTNTTEGNNHGSIQLRTGLLNGREIEIEGTGTANDRAYDVLKTVYDKNLDQTTVFLSGDLFVEGVFPTPTPTATVTPTPSVGSSVTPTPTTGVSATPTPTITSTLTPTITPTITPTLTATSGSPPAPAPAFVRMYGYLQDSGFDGGPECSAPKHSHAKVGMSELIQIKFEGPAISPTPTATVTPTETLPAVSPQPTPTGTPNSTVPPGETPNPTPPVTPTPSPSG